MLVARVDGRLASPIALARQPASHDRDDRADHITTIPAGFDLDETS
jgi:hypothetical protein